MSVSLFILPRLPPGWRLMSHGERKDQSRKLCYTHEWLHVSGAWVGRAAKGWSYCDSEAGIFKDNLEAKDAHEAFAKAIKA